MRRLKLIRPPQLGHKCFELGLSPSIVVIMTSAAENVVMAVTVDLDFWQAPHPADDPRAHIYLKCVLGGTCERNCLSAYR